MDTADKIGLLSGFGWMAGHGVLVTLAICWALTPIAMLAIAKVLEDRRLPLDSRRQFGSFFPGDVFLSASVAGMLVLAQSLPNRSAFYNATWWHVLVLVGAVVVAFLMTYVEWKDGAYPTRAIFSPTKLYHNGLLYGGYGYVAITTLVAVTVGLWGQPVQFWLIPVLAPGLVWVSYLVKDNTLVPGSEAQKTKCANAHIEDWHPIWSR